LAQQYAEREFLIIDSGSQDDADEIADAVDDERVRIIPTATTTPIYDSFNLAVQESHGKFVKPICAGDTLHPDCVAKQASILDDDHEVALVAVRTDHVDDDGKLLTHACGVVGLVGRHAAGRAITRIARCSADPVGPPVAGLFRRLGFDECGGCQEDLLFPMDMGLWVRLLSHGEFLKLSTTLASSRIGSGAMTHLLRRAAHRTSAKGGNR
jgi:glycosyltransferase involved in cell wall biosynthesis